MSFNLPPQFKRDLSYIDLHTLLFIVVKALIYT